ncbi:MAG: SDR family oxidoreductase [Verrucomicrobiota bacterium]|nr:SDR family oxidoreductase [Verrucomicrobiota bacterium]
MKVLFIGGTGNISSSCVRLAVERGMEVFVLNRGQRACELPKGVRTIVADIHKPESVRLALGDLRFDAVANFIAFTPDEIERDIALFKGRTLQYHFISSASAYQKPVPMPFVTESSPLKNPHWQYSRNKIACEDRLHKAFREEDFPMVIVRPSLTYGTVWPVAIGGWSDLTLVDRIRKGGSMVVHGDGTSLWTVTHSDDFAKGFVGLLGNSTANGHAFHITSDEVLTWDQIYTVIAEVAGVEPKLIHIPSKFLAVISPWEKENLLGDKAHSLIFDNSKIKRFVPDFKATINFREGAERTLAWFEAKAERQIIRADVNTSMDGYIAAWKKAMDTIKPA